MMKSPRRMTLVLVILFFLVPVSSWGLTAGPDGFGYTYKDSTELSMPAFEWTDISKSGNARALTDKNDARDKVFGPISIGFPFRFYGIEYRELYIASNGLVSFNPDIGIAWPETKSTFPFGGDGVNNLIAGLWALLNPTGTWGVVNKLHYETRGVSPNRQFVVQYTRVTYTSDASHATYDNTFQIVLYEGKNDIQVNYLDVTTRGPGKDMAFAGIENRFGNQGLRYGPMSLAGHYSKFYVRYYSPESTVVEPPSKPIVISPRTSTAETQPAYSWYRVENASRYLLTVYGGGDVIHRSDYDAGETGSGTICSIRPPSLYLVDKGTYSWNVSALDAAGRAAVSDTVTFTVQVGSVTPPVPFPDPSLSSPACLNTLYFPHVVHGADWETEIAIINTSEFKTIYGKLRLYNSLGEEVSDPVTINLLPLKKYETTLGDLAQDKPERSQTAYMVFYGDSERMVGFSRSGVEGLYRESIPALLHRNANRGDIFIPHVISEGSWKNEVILLNTEDTEKTVIMEFTMEASDPVNWEVTLQGGEKKTLNMYDIVSEPLFQGGRALSAVIRQDPADPSAIVAVALYERGSQLAAIPLSGLKETDLVYSHIPNHSWNTGIVLFNPGGSEENVTVTAYDETGSQVDELTLPVASGVRVITNPAIGPGFTLPPEAVWFRASSAGGLSGCEFFGRADETRFAGLRVTGSKSERGIFPTVEKPSAGVTGISLVNPNGETAAVKLEALRIVDDRWDVFASVDKEIPPQGKLVGAAASFFDEDISRAYYIRYKSDQPLVGFQVNSAFKAPVLDAIPALGGEPVKDELIIEIESDLKLKNGKYTYYLNMPGTLAGVTEDPGGYTSGNEETLSYTWSSSLDGTLGQGKDLDLSALTLSLGEHRITLEVVDPETGAWGAAALPNPIIVKGDMLPMS